MNFEPITHSSLYCIFADEMRREADGRDSILGWYPDGANIAMPLEGTATLQRILVVAIMTVPLSIESSDFIFELLLNETVIYTNKISQQQIQGMAAPNNEVTSPLRATVFRIAVQVQNLLISEPGTLRARISLGDQLLHSNGLQFIRVDPVLNI